MATERRKRCEYCKELKPRNPDHPVFCTDCVPLYQADLAKQYEEFQQKAADRIKARTPQDHIRIAEQPLSARRMDSMHRERGAYDCSVEVDADSLAWLVDLAKSVHPEGQTIAMVEMSIEDIQQYLIEGWKEDHTN